MNKSPVAKMKNIGPKSAAWLRQVGIHTQEELLAIGSLGAFVKVKRAGFKPSLNLLYALEGAILDCHWQEIPEARRSELVLSAEAAVDALPPARGRAVGLSPVRTFEGEAADAASTGSQAPIGFYDISEPANGEATGNDGSSENERSDD